MPPDDLNGHTLKWIEIWLRFESKDEELWYDFSAEFANWSEDEFKQLRREVRKSLRDFLCNNGVPLPKGRHISMAKALSDNLDEEEWRPGQYVRST